MPRRATRPRYWPSKGGYYLTVNKRTWLLARGGRDDPVVLAQAEANARELLAQVEVSGVANYVIEQDREALAKRASPHLLHALDFLWLTGCRPEEAVGVSAG